MDFKKLISHIESIDGPIETPKAPQAADPIRLDEGTELRVLAGVTALTESVIAEKAVSKAQQKFMGMVHATQKGEKAPSKEVAKVAKSMGKKDAKDFASTKHKGLPEKKTEEGVEEGFDAGAKPGDKKKTQHGELTKTATGVKHERKYGKDADGEDSKEKKAKKESIDSEAFKNKFSKMVEAKKGSKPDFLDVDKDGDKKEPMKKAVADKKKGAVKEEMKVGDKKKSSTGGTIEKTKTGVKHTAGKNYGGKASEGEDKKSKKDESVDVKKKAKKLVKESVEGKLSFKEMMKLVVESGGQQQIDPIDRELFAWATRVAKQKLGEGMKAEVYAGMVYERMGGTFELYDILSESTVSCKKQIKESVDPEDIEVLLGQLKSGEIDYDKFKDQLDSLEHTDSSMRRGEMGMQGDDTPAGNRAWDREKSDWDELDRYND